MKLGIGMSAFKSLLSGFVQLNRKLSRGLDRLVLPDTLRVDGNTYFKTDIVPGLLANDLRVYDLGGGSNPYLSPEQKSAYNLFVVGVDINAEELEAAPNLAYDRTICADLCTYNGKGDADLVICQATLEHVPDVAGSLRAIAECLAPGGRACIFAPSRNAAFARLNLVLAEGLKRKLLFALFPEKANSHDGFKAYYDRCTPAQIEAIAAENNLEIETRKLFYISSYFTILTPAFILWRLSQGLAYLAIGTQAAETFAYVLRKPEE